MCRRIIILTLLLCSEILSSQNPEQRILDSTNRDEIETLFKKADGFYKTDLDSALFYIDAAKHQLQSYNNPELKGKSLIYQSKFLLYKKDYGNIIAVLEPNLKNAQFLSQETLGRTYKDIGHAYKQKWLPDSALVNYIKALKCFENTKNRRDISITYLALGLVYSKIGNKDLAKSFYDKSIKFSDNTEIMKVHKDQLINTPNPASNNDIIEASLDIAKIAENRKNYRLLAITYGDIKEEYFALKNYDKALEYANNELRIRKQSNFDSRLSTTMHFIGEIHLKRNEIQQAIPILNDAIDDATDSLRLHIYKDLKIAYVTLGNSNKAIEYMEAYDGLKDSIVARNTEASIVEITANYNDEQQKQQIQTLNFQNEAKAEKISNQRLTLLSTIAGSILLLLLGYFAYKNYKSKQDLNYAQLNFKLLQTQLNPHFLFNALNEIKLNLKSDNIDNSAENLTAYSRLMRLILEGSNEDFVPIRDDLELISKFLNLQALVHDNRFSYDVKIDDAIDSHYMQMPPMLTQPFVENAILHGIKSVENGHIEVSYQSLEDHVQIEISDNGKGIFEVLDHSGKHLHKSMGTRIINQRIKNYTKLYNFKIEVRTISNPESGTRIEIKFPIKLE